MACGACDKTLCDRERSETEGGAATLVGETAFFGGPAGDSSATRTALPTWPWNAVSNCGGIGRGTNVGRGQSRVNCTNGM